MDEQLGRNAAMTILVSLALAALAGLFAWGPMPAGPVDHRLADTRTLLGIPNALNVLVSLPCIGMSLWAWRVTRASALPPELKRTWCWFQLAGLMTSVCTAPYHLQPGPGLHIASHVFLATACALITGAFLAERVDPWFATPAARVVALVLPLMMAAPAVLGWLLGQAVDMRPLHWLQIVPILLVPAGALGLRGRYTSRSDWMAALGLYGMAGLADIADTRLFEATGIISGHTVYHLGLAAVTAWTGYLAARTPVSDDPAGTPSQPQTALKTAG